MDYTINYREKNGGIQVIIQYKTQQGWKQKSKQGFENNRSGKKKARDWADNTVNHLKDLLKIETENSSKSQNFKEYTYTFLKYKKPHISEGTYRNYETVLSHFAVLNDIPLESITNINIQEIINSLIESGYAISTVKDYKGKLNTIFDTAITKYKLIKENPVKDIEIKKDVENDEVEVISKSDSDAILNMLKKSQDIEYYYMTLIALKAGLRIGEICGLTDDVINLKRNTITINKQWKQLSKNKYGFGPPKNKKTRVVPIPPILSRELKVLKSRKIKSVDNRLFDVKSTAVVAARLSQIFKKFGYDISIHTFRHTYATNLIGNGLDFKTAAVILGHTVEMTMKTYSHVNNDMLLKATKIISENF